ncbi:helix-turn-helix transcriptional regulator [Nocardioides acrostichi]|uniref:YafY family transcriptional regulator n=1 Tax=Nocardioides acrostichi TaxID=2784339 RepID=A0A930UX84_9ACTN|nr:YafY family protein [Nocardioides acrostichi]MBF4160064.1 YafY family transcriptional regulator [Nocardioides acrostichi]
MSETSTGPSGRLLQLLSLLQTPREWPGPVLARRLEVSERTVRNDVERLRRLGYPVEATRGSTGGYRLAAGAAMPPLLLDDDEAVAITLALRTAIGGSVSGLEQSSLQALTKLQQVLPRHLRGQVDALTAAHQRVGRPHRGSDEGGGVEAGVLTLLAEAVRDRVIVRFGYADHSGAQSERRVEPYRLVSMGRRWYLVAWDVHRDGWRTFRVDRLRETRSVGHGYRPRPLPADDVAAWVAERTRAVRHRLVGTVRVHLPAETVQQWLGWWVVVSIEVETDDCCLVRIGGQSWEGGARWLATLDGTFEVLDPPELLEAVREVADRLARSLPSGARSTV